MSVKNPLRIEYLDKVVQRLSSLVYAHSKRLEIKCGSPLTSVEFEEKLSGLIEATIKGRANRLVALYMLEEALLKYETGEKL